MIEWYTVVLIALLVFMSALFSGLTLGLMGLDLSELEVSVHSVAVAYLVSYIL
jgi:CBS domain containing-hemolysin-like protein